MLKTGWAWWRRLARVIGNAQARVLLTLFYFVLVPPFALIVKLSRDPLALAERDDGGYWTTRPRPDDPGTAGRRQF